MSLCLIFGKKKYNNFVIYRLTIMKMIVELIEKYGVRGFLVHTDSDFGKECKNILENLQEKYTIDIYPCFYPDHDTVDAVDVLLTAVWKRDRKGKKLLDYARIRKKLYLDVYDFFIRPNEKKIKTIHDYIEKQDLLGKAKLWLKVLKGLYEQEEKDKNGVD